MGIRRFTDNELMELSKVLGDTSSGFTGTEIGALLTACGFRDPMGYRWRRVRPDPRQPKAEWFLNLRDRCVEAEVAFFFKQSGGCISKSGGRLLDGRDWSEMPTARERWIGRRSTNSYSCSVLTLGTSSRVTGPGCQP